MSLICAVPLALLGLTIASSCPVLGVLCGYGAGLLVKFDVRDYRDSSGLGTGGNIPTEMRRDPAP